LLEISGDKLLWNGAHRDVRIWPHVFRQNVRSAIPWWLVFAKHAILCEPANMTQHESITRNSRFALSGTQLRKPGLLRLFRISSIEVFLHWSWFVIAAIEITARSKSYTFIGWNVAEYCALFAIVLLHEFGHALACRQVGGIANRIVLWPLGGAAYVNPPPRPGATLWSIAAGPLVNVVLIFAFFVCSIISRTLEWGHSAPNLYALLRSVTYINFALLMFNLLPIYPLDGGQILRSLLWFIVGRARSLMVATSIGFLGAVGLIGVALWDRSTWVALLAAFVLMNCWGGWRQARLLSRLSKLPRHSDFACPGCRAAPPMGEFWRCNKCGNRFDTFQNRAICPYCAAQYPSTMCMDCRRQYPIGEWLAPSTATLQKAKAGLS